MNKNSSQPHDRIPELDLLRFLAATLVVLFHYTYRPVIDAAPDTTAFNGFQHFSKYGYLGVQLFFLISGFVILWSADGRTAAGFAKSRFLRLYPMFWLGVVMTLAVLIMAGEAEQFSLRVVLMNMTIVPAYFSVPMVDGVYWTLGIEVRFYAMVLILIIAGQMPRIEWWIYAWLAGLLLVTYVDIGPLKSLTMLPHGFFFVGGALCYMIRSRGRSLLRTAALVICALASAWHLSNDTDFTSVPVVNPAKIAVTILVFYIVLFCIAVKAIRLPSAPVLYILGALTYPLYLLHNRIGDVIFGAFSFLEEWPRLLVTLTAAYILAWLCALFIEPAARSSMAAALAWRPRPALITKTGTEND